MLVAPPAPLRPAQVPCTSEAASHTLLWKRTKPPTVVFAFPYHDYDCDGDNDKADDNE